MKLRVPVKESFEKNLSRLKLDDLFNPVRIISDSGKSIISDHILYLFLINFRDTKNILDLGCFFGLTPFIVNDIAHSVNLNLDDIRWNLVDNQSFTKTLKEIIVNNGPNHQFRQWQIQSWLKSKMIPETSAEELKIFWQNLSKNRNIPHPNIEFSESIENNLNIFDIILFDLNASDFESNHKIFLEILEKNMNDDTILILDDVKPMHPQQMALYQEIVTKHNFSPIAFSLTKVALVSKKSKTKIIQQIKFSIHVNKPDNSWRTSISRKDWFHFEFNTQSQDNCQGSYFYISPKFFYQTQRNPFYE